MKPTLSIIIPSIYPNKLDRFIKSLHATASNMEKIELVQNSTPTGGVCPILESMVREAQADWVFFTNDDLIAETPDWDLKFRKCAELFEDGVALFWPNDCLFEDMLSCFPLMRRDIALSVFPTPYRKYKLDDTIFAIYPDERKFYLPDIVFRHTNVIVGGEGYRLPDGRIYPVDYKIAELDNYSWICEAPKRKLLHHRLKLKAAGYE